MNLGFKKSAICSSRPRRFSSHASDFSPSLIQWGRAHASCLLEFKFSQVLCFVLHKFNATVAHNCHGKIQSHGTSNLTHGKTMLSDGKTKLTQGSTPLIHGKTKLTHGRTPLIHGKRSLLTAKQSLLTAKQSLLTAKQRKRVGQRLVSGWSAVVIQMVCRVTVTH